MMTTPHPNASADRSASGAEPESPHARRLRERLQALTEEARRLSRILPQAVTMSAQGGGLAEALTPAVERALTISGQRAPEAIGNALKPVIWRALRAACRHSLYRGVQALDRRLLQYASFTGLRWRWEARRAGIPFKRYFAERTLHLPVKQVFLIHRETGILLQQARGEDNMSQDWDVVSGMLTAIGDFVHDSFKVAREERLETIRVGTLTILIEQGRYAALAGILRTDTPENLRERFRSSLERIHAEFGRELEAFDGDTAVFDRSRDVLDTCLHPLVAMDRSRLLPQTWLVLGVPVALGALWCAQTWREQARWRAFLYEVNAQPGLVVLEHGKRDGRFFVRGLRDPSAPEPTRLLAEHGLFVGGVDSRWVAVQWAAAPPSPQRLRELLQAPEGVALSVEDGRVILRGSATREWLDTARERLRTLGAVTAVDTGDVTISDLGDYHRWERYVQQLEHEPGLVVLNQGHRNGRFFVRGLRDPLAREPSALLAPFGLAPGDIDARWESYQALEPVFTLERARLALEPPREVTLDLRDSVLYVAGRAPRRWIEQAEGIARGLPGIRTVHMQQLVDTDLEALVAIQTQIEAEGFRFLRGAPDLWPGQGGRIESLVGLLDRLDRAVSRRNQTYLVEIRGHTESTGNPQRDMADSLELAGAFHETLRSMGVNMGRFQKRGMGTVQPRGLEVEVRETHNRLATLKVTVSDR